MNREYHVASFILAVFSSISFAYLVTRGLYYSPDVIRIAFYAILSSAVMFYFFKIGWVQSLIQLTVLFTLYLFYGLLLKDFHFLTQAVEYIYRSVSLNVALTSEYTTFMTIFFTLMISSIFSLLIYHRKYIFLLIVSLIVTVLFATYSLANLKLASLFVVLGGLFLLGLKHFDHIEKHEIVFMNYLLYISKYLFPFILIVYLFSTYATLDFDFIDDWLEGDGTKTIEKVSHQSSVKESIDRESIINPNTVLTIEGNKTLYLRYNVLDTYLHGEWTSRSNNESQTLANEDGITVFSIEDMRKEVLDGDMNDLDFYDMIDQEDIKITFQNVDSDVLFLPLYINTISTTLESVNQSDEGIIFADEFFEKGFSYEANVFLYDFTSKKLTDRLKAATHDVDLSEEEFTRYTQIDEATKNKLLPLVTSITAEATNSYEELLAIEGYLRDNFTYDLDASYETDAFIDDFLFNEQKGFCIHYATAFTLMTRALELPVRYVEGYVSEVTFRAYQLNISDGRFVTNITGQSAHSFPEVYFDGIGWIQFEPTPTNEIERGIDFISPEYGPYDPSKFKKSVFYRIYDFIKTYIFTILLIFLTAGFLVYFLIKYSAYRKNHNLVYNSEFNTFCFNLEELGFELQSSDTMKEFQVKNHVHLARFIDQDELRKIIDTNYTIVFHDAMAGHAELVSLKKANIMLARKILDRYLLIGKIKYLYKLSINKLKTILFK